MLDKNTKFSNARDVARKNQRCTVDYWQPGADRKIQKGMIEKFGIDAQILQFIEECGEMLTALSHYERKRCGSVAVVNELVDLTIMIEQMKLIYDPCDTEFTAIYKYKMDRMKKLLGDK